MKLIRSCQILLYVLCVSLLNAQTDSLVLEGKFTGENIYIKNSQLENLEINCTIKLKINEQIITDDFHSDAYEIRLDTCNLNKNDSYKIIIYHNINCLPEKINKIILTNPTYDILGIEIDSTGKLNWSTKNEDGSRMYYVEQFIWGRWIIIGEVFGTGRISLNRYSFQLKFHSGENIFRLKQLNQNNKPRYSKSIYFHSPLQKASLLNHLVRDEIEFSREVQFEIYDDQGNLKAHGISKIVDVSRLQKGHYFLNFDSETSEFIKQ